MSKDGRIAQIRARRANLHNSKFDRDSFEFNAASDIDHLLAIVDKLPKFADTGDPIVPGMKVYTPNTAGKIVGLTICLDAVGFDDPVGTELMNTAFAMMSPTREAAAKKRDKDNG